MLSHRRPPTAGRPLSTSCSRSHDLSGAGQRIGRIVEKHQQLSYVNFYSLQPSKRARPIQPQSQRAHGLYDTLKKTELTAWFVRNMVQILMQIAPAAFQYYGAIARKTENVQPFKNYLDFSGGEPTAGKAEIAGGGSWSIS